VLFLYPVFTYEPTRKHEREDREAGLKKVFAWRRTFGGRGLLRFDRRITVAEIRKDPRIETPSS
jgi:hypothetical protein